MNFEVKLTPRIGTWALRAAGLVPTAEYHELFHRYYGNKITLPATVTCPYFPSEKSMGVRVTIYSYSPVDHFKIEVDDEAIGNKIREKLVHYSEENRGLAVSDREHEALYARIDEILKPDGVTKEDVERGTVVLTRRAQEALMHLHDEVEPIRRGNIFWQFTKSAIPKADRVFVAQWLVKRFATEKDPIVRSDIVTVFYNCKGLAVREITDDLIQQITNRSYGMSRCGLCEVLAKTKDPRAADVIASVLDDDSVARAALESLGKLRAQQHLATIKKFIRHSSPDVRREAKRTLKKLGHPVETPLPPIHLVKNKKSLPKDLVEWSANLDIEDLNPTLEKLAQCVDAGFGSKEIAEVAGVADETKHDQTKAFRFPVTAQGQESELWVVIFMDDIDSPDLYVHANPEIVQKFGDIVDLKG